MSSKSFTTKRLNYTEDRIGTQSVPWSHPFSDTFTRTGGDAPNFKAEYEAGVIRINPLNASWSDFRFKQVGVAAGYAPALGAFYTEAQGQTYYGGYSGTLEPFLGNAQNRAVIGIRNKIRDVKSSLSGPTFLGELRETIRMIRNPAASLMKEINNFSKKASRARARESKTNFKKVLPDLYLEATFGWRPLISDISAAAEASVTFLEENLIQRVKFTAKEQGHVGEAYAQPNMSPLNSIAVGLRGYVILDISVKYVAWVKMKETMSGGLDGIIQASKFDLSEIIPTAWELLPWSFLIDYFSNIGDVLSSHTVDLSNVIAVSKTTRILKQTNRVAYIRILSLPEKFTKQIPSHSVLTQGSITREAATLPYGELRFEFPGFMQGINMSALYASAKMSKR